MAGETGAQQVRCEGRTREGEACPERVAYQVVMQGQEGVQTYCAAHLNALYTRAPGSIATYGTLDEGVPGETPGQESPTVQTALEAALKALMEAQTCVRAALEEAQRHSLAGEVTPDFTAGGETI